MYAHCIVHEITTDDSYYCILEVDERFLSLRLWIRFHKYQIPHIFKKIMVSGSDVPFETNPVINPVEHEYKWIGFHIYIYVVFRSPIKSNNH